MTGNGWQMPKRMPLHPPSTPRLQGMYQCHLFWCGSLLCCQLPPHWTSLAEEDVPLAQGSLQHFQNVKGNSNSWRQLANNMVHACLLWRNSLCVQWVFLPFTRKPSWIGRLLVTGCEKSYSQNRSSCSDYGFFKYNSAWNCSVSSLAAQAKSHRGHFVLGRKQSSWAPRHQKILLLPVQCVYGTKLHLCQRGWAVAMS